MEKKYHDTDKGKINPYAAAAFGIGTGRIRSTDDIIRTGAFPGSMGSFDIDADVPDSEVWDDPALNQIHASKANIVAKGFRPDE